MLAAASVHAANGWVHMSAGGGWEYPAFLSVASIVAWLLGDGAFDLRRRARPVNAGGATHDTRAHQVP